MVAKLTAAPAVRRVKLRVGGVPTQSEIVIYVE